MSHFTVSVEGNESGTNWANVKKQYESCSKQSQISREEYTNLRREYKEIKGMLSDQIKKYKKDTDAVEATHTHQKCKIICDLKKQLEERDNQITILQQKLKDASYEIIELKDYIHKLISDNNILKSAINNLIGNLERKIKGPSFKNLQSNCADAIAGEILQSLTAIEGTIIKKFQNRYCSHGCGSKECDCMSKIESQYQANESEQGTSRICSSDYSHKVEQYCKEPCYTVPRPSTNQTTNISSSSTTDSEECQHCNSFLDQKSMEFLKEAIHGLKRSKDNTMKEKSCDCEQ